MCFHFNSFLKWISEFSVWQMNSLSSASLDYSYGRCSHCVLRFYSFSLNSLSIVEHFLIKWAIISIDSFCFCFLLWRVITELASSANRLLTISIFIAHRFATYVCDNLTERTTSAYFSGLRKFTMHTGII